MERWKSAGYAWVTVRNKRVYSALADTSPSTEYSTRGMITQQEKISEKQSTHLQEISVISWIKTVSERKTMASHNQSYKAGEARGQSEEKTDQMMEIMKEKAREAKEKTAETAQAAKEKTSQTTQAAKDKTSQTAQAAKEKTGPDSPTAQAAKEKTGQTAQSAKEKASGTTEAAKQKRQETAQEAREKAEVGKEETGGIVQKTGEQVKSMAQGAAEAVKHTFGFDSTGDDDDVDEYENNKTTKTPSTTYRRDY
ncbi:hypothetical protein Patl1_34456 [Pistacia atlantica]|uniref:Uncharacterized protein n=1 Tax=Pistacia atlantica TaxID=434234 RepID=A0ACC0ZTU9_9ROSI|nr:hypothetical protein Patl1_34456 [Pistacia atlantica]